MFKKVFGLVAIAGTIGVFSGVGCTTTTSTSDGGTATDSGGVATDAPTGDTGKPPPKPDSGPAGCYDESGAIGLSKDAKEPKAAQGLCTAAQVNGFQANCLGPTADNAKCKAFIDDAANKACLPCIEGSKDGPAPVLLPANKEGNSVFVNTFACGFLTINRAACANPSASYLMCLASSCDSCDEKDTKAQDDCEAKAIAGVCKQGEPTKECTDAFTAGKTAIDAACRGTDFIGTYTKVANFLCGSGGGPVDGGGG